MPKSNKSKTTKPKKTKMVSKASPPSKSYFSVAKPFTTPGCSVTLGPRMEFVGPVDSGTNINPLWRALPLSVGVNVTFPWLSGIAGSFEYFQLHSLRIHYKPNVASTFAGTVMIGCDYDAGDVAPFNINELGSWEGTVSGRAYDDLTFTASPKHLALYKNRMIETTSTAITSDPRLNSCGTVYVYTAGNTSTTTSGYLYVEYTVTLSGPQSSQGVSGNLNITNKETVSTGTKIFPLTGLSAISSTVSNLIEVSPVAGTDQVQITAKKPIRATLDIAVPPPTTGTVQVPAAGDIAKALGTGSSFWKNNSNTAISSFGGMLSYLADFKNVGDYVRIQGGSGSNAAWATNLISNIIVEQIASSFDPAIAKWNTGTNVWTSV